MCQEEKKLDPTIITEISWFLTDVIKRRLATLVIALMVYFLSDIVDGIFS